MTFLSAKSKRIRHDVIRANSPDGFHTKVQRSTDLCVKIEMKHDFVALQVIHQTKTLSQFICLYLLSVCV